MSFRQVGLRLERGLILRHGLRLAARHPGQRFAEIVLRLGVLGLDAERRLILRDRFLRAPGFHQGVAEVVVRNRRAGHHLYGRLILRDGFGRTARHFNSALPRSVRACAYSGRMRSAS